MPADIGPEFDHEMPQHRRGCPGLERSKDEDRPDDNLFPLITCNENPSRRAIHLNLPITGQLNGKTGGIFELSPSPGPLASSLTDRPVASTRMVSNPGTKNKSDSKKSPLRGWFHRRNPPYHHVRRRLNLLWPFALLPPSRSYHSNVWQFLRP